MNSQNKSPKLILTWIPQIYVAFTALATAFSVEVGFTDHSHVRAFLHIPIQKNFMSYLLHDILSLPMSRELRQGTRTKEGEQLARSNTTVRLKVEDSLAECGSSFRDPPHEEAFRIRNVI